ILTTVFLSVIPLTIRILSSVVYLTSLSAVISIGFVSLSNGGFKDEITSLLILNKKNIRINTDEIIMMNFLLKSFSMSLLLLTVGDSGSSETVIFLRGPFWRTKSFLKSRL